VDISEGAAVKEQTFEPITTQAEFDERIKARLAREREKWEKASGGEDLQAQLEAKDQEIANIKQEHYRENVRRAVVGELASKGVTDEGRVGRIMKHVDLEAIEATEDGQPDRRSIQGQLAAVNRDMPELLSYRVGAGSRGSKSPVLTPNENRLTRDELEKMSPEEINQPGTWERVQQFLTGERG
jgi:hypothetical protein